MAIVALTANKGADGKTGPYSVVELNQVNARYTGNIIADKPTVVSADTGKITARGHDGQTQTVLENGMIVTYGVDGICGTSQDAAGFGLVYNTERIYNDYQKDLASFCIPEDQIARVYNLTPGDVFTTDAIYFNDSAAYTSDGALTSAVVGKFVSTNVDGYSLIVDSAASEDVYGIIEELTTTPASQPGAEQQAVKIRVMKGSLN